MELYFIRHGQSENNANWENEEIQDVPDPELTQVGLQQAEILARYLSQNQERDKKIRWNTQNQHGYGLTHIYTSLMVRAVNTAILIAEAISRPLHAWAEIHETGGIFSRDGGDTVVGLPGKNRAYFESHFPNLGLPNWLDENGWWNRPFEEPEERKLRAEQVWADLLARHGDQPNRPEHRVCIVSHGGFFNYLYTSALGIKMRRISETHHAYWVLMNNCAITRLDVKDDQVLVAYTNRNHFLPKDLIT